LAVDSNDGNLLNNTQNGTAAASDSNSTDGNSTDANEVWVPEYLPNCNASADIRTNCLPSCNTVLGENTECYPLCEEGMDITVECSSYNTPINPKNETEEENVPEELKEPEKVVVFIQPEPIIEVSYVETTKETSYVEY
jgi:hypothetical protein